MSVANEQAQSKTAYLGAAASDYDAKRFLSPQGLAIAEQESNLLAQVLRTLGSSSAVLEVGVGTGRFLAQVAKMNHHAHGIDASPDMLTQTQQRFDGAGISAELQCSGAAMLPHDENSMDLVYSIRVLNQTESADYALAAVSDMFRVVRPGGKLLVEFVNARRPLVLLDRCNVRLSHDQVEEKMRALGGHLVWRRGLFFFGMTAYQRCPSKLLSLLTRIDRLFAGLFPRFCARGYCLICK